MMLGFILAILFCIGDYESAMLAPLPIIEIYYGATQSKTIATVMVLMGYSINVLALFNCTASVSRLTWAFARDKGLPFSDYFSYVSPFHGKADCGAERCLIHAFPDPSSSSDSPSRAGPRLIHLLPSLFCLPGLRYRLQRFDLSYCTRALHFLCHPDSFVAY